MRIGNVRLICIVVCFVGFVQAGSGSIKVQNSETKIKLQLHADDYKPIVGQPEYVVEPKAVQIITVPNIPGKYRLFIVFPGLEVAGFATFPVEITQANQLVTLPNQTENYNYMKAYKKSMETPEPEVHGGSW